MFAVFLISFTAARVVDRLKDSENPPCSPSEESLATTDAPGMYGLPCSFYANVIKAQFPKGAITTVEECATGQAIVAKACENYGFDEFTAASCHAGLPAVFETACSSSVDTWGTFTAEACTKLVSCPWTGSSAVALATTSTLAATPGMYGLPCSFYEDVIKAQFPKGAITTVDECATGQAIVAKACDNSGFDEFTAASCHAGLPAVFETACTSSVDTWGTFTAEACTKLVSCPWTPTSATELATTSTDGMYGLPCSFYDDVIKAQFPNGQITTVDECATGQAIVAKACDNSGFDEFTAASCHAGLPAVFETACSSSVDTWGTFTAEACTKLVGCPWTGASATELATTTDAPGMYGLPCSFYDDVIKAQFPKGAITTVEECATGQEVVAKACTNSGFNFVTAASCHAGLPAVFETACTSSVDTWGTFTAEACTKLVSCPWTGSSAVALATTSTLASTPGMYGLPCSFYENVIKAQFPKGAITTVEECATGQEIVAKACDNSGFDEFTAASCHAGLPATFETACSSSVDTWGTFTAEACTKLVSCPWTPTSTAELATTDAPGMYGLPCSFYADVIKAQFPKGAISTVEECATGQAIVAKACENSGFDEFTAASCHAGLPAVFETSCTSSVDTWGTFTAEACTKLVGCPWTGSSAVALATTSTDGMYGLPCSFYGDVIKAQFPKGQITTVEECATGQAIVAKACDNSGFDEFTAASCHAGLPAVFETACSSSVDTWGTFTAEACTKLVGCPWTGASAVALATTTTDGMYGLPCSFYDDVIKAQFPKGAITTVEECATGQAIVAKACDNSGFDEFTAASCHAGLPAVFETACSSSVDTWGTFTAEACTKLVGCPWNSLAAPDKVE